MLILLFTQFCHVTWSNLPAATMGACCGGMKTSHQHKSLPEKNKAAAAAAAANEQQLNNDAVAAKTATSGVEGEESQLVMNNGDEQLETATKTTSLEACPPGPLKQNGSPPEALHGNHIDDEQQQPVALQVEGPDLLVASWTTPFSLACSEFMPNIAP